MGMDTMEKVRQHPWGAVTGWLPVILGLSMHQQQIGDRGLCSKRASAE
jgi:hypothetical protein